MKRIRSSFSALVSIALLLLLYRMFDLRASELATGIVDWRYLVAAVVMPTFVIGFITINRWQLFLMAAGIKENFLSLWRINLIAMFRGLVLPSTQGYDVMRIYYIERRHPDKQGLAGSTVFVERAIGLVLLCLFSAAALPFVAQTPEFMPLVLIVAGICVGVFSTLALILSRRLHQCYAGARFRNPTLSRAFTYIARFHGAVVHFPLGQVLAAAVFWIMCFQLSVVTTVDLVFRAYGCDIPFIQHLVMYPVIAVLSMVPITLGGFGLREGLFLYFYGLVGISPVVAVGASILVYMILILVPATLGGAIVLWETLRGASGREPGSDGEGHG